MVPILGLAWSSEWGTKFAHDKQGVRSKNEQYRTAYIRGKPLTLSGNPHTGSNAAGGKPAGRSLRPHTRGICVRI